MSTKPTNPELAREIITRYPWLARVKGLDPNDTSLSLRIKRATKELLATEIWDEVGTEASCYSRYHRVTLRRADGAIIGKVAAGTHDWGSGSWSGGETIADAIARRGALPDFILWIDDESGSAVNDAPPSLTATLYKPPTEGWGELLAERKVRARLVVDQMEGVADGMTYEQKREVALSCLRHAVKAAELGDLPVAACYNHDAAVALEAAIEDISE